MPRDSRVHPAAKLWPEVPETYAVIYGRKPGGVYEKKIMEKKCVCACFAEYLTGVFLHCRRSQYKGKGEKGLPGLSEGEGIFDLCVHLFR